MKSFTTNDYGRLIVMHMANGDLVLENIRAELNRLGVRDAVLVSGIGSMQKLVFHTITDDPNMRDKFITLEKAIEVGSMQGLVLDGEPHLHLVCAHLDDSFIGHLEDGCEVKFLLELAFLEIKNIHLIRRLNEEGIGYIDAK